MWHLYKGDLIQLKSKGLFYVMSINPIMIQSMSGGNIIPLHIDDKFTLLSSGIYKDKLKMTVKIRNFIKVCLSL